MGAFDDIFKNVIDDLINTVVDDRPEEKQQKYIEVDAIDISEEDI